MFDERLFTKHDIKIFQSLATIESLLEDHLRQSGIITFELNGTYTDISFSEWKFSEPFESAITHRQKEIINYFDKYGFELDYDIEKLNIVKTTGDWIVEKENKLQEHHKVNSDRKIAFQEKEIMAPKFLSGLKGDPLILSYYYIRNLFDSDFFEQDSTVQSFKRTIYGEDYNIQDVISHWSGHIEWGELIEITQKDDNPVGNKKYLALSVAKYEIYKKYLDKIKFYSYKDSLNLFLNDFLSLSKFHIKIKDKSSGFGILDFFQGLKSLVIKDIREYIKSDKEIIINFPTYLSYKTTMVLLDKEKFNNYWTYDSFFIPIFLEELTKEEVILAELMSFISLRLELFDYFFDVMLQKIIEEPQAKKYFSTNIQLVEYLIKYLKALINNTGELYISVFQRIKLPQEVSRQLLSCFLEIMENKLACMNGTAYQNLLALHENESARIFTSLANKLQEIQKDIKENTILPSYFSTKKLLWPAEKIPKLEAWFQQLYLQRNKYDKPFMSQEDVEYMLKANFSCFQDNIKPVPLEFHGHSGTLVDYVYQFFYNDQSSYNSKKRYAQFLIQNFIHFNERISSQEKFNNFVFNLRPKKLKRRGKIMPPEK